MIAGVDGCKKGWVVAVGDGWSSQQRPRLLFCETFKLVLKATDTCEVVAVDMPIGIPSGAQRRDCDLQAIKALGKAASRVFLTPPRESLCAKTPVEFQEIHRNLRDTGAGFVVWGIVPKIKEVDEVMKPQLQDRVFEFHPELVWKRLAGNVLDSKHTASGILQRISIVEEYVGGIKHFREDKGAMNGAIDDVLDALVGLSVAHCIATGPDYNGRLPGGQSPKDSRGLKMEIWY